MKRGVCGGSILSCCAAILTGKRAVESREKKLRWINISLSFFFTVSGAKCCKSFVLKQTLIKYYMLFAYKKSMQQQPVLFIMNVYSLLI